MYTRTTASGAWLRTLALLILALAGLGLMGTSPPAHAATRPAAARHLATGVNRSTPPGNGPVTTVRTGCSQVSGGQVSPSGGWGEVWWDTTGCGFFLRPRLLCASRFGGTVYAYGGWITRKWLHGRRLHSRATCPSDHSQLQVMWRQIKETANGAKHTCELYPNPDCPGAAPLRHHRATARTVAVARRCSHTWQGNAYPSASPPNATAWWTCNTPARQGRVHLRCRHHDGTSSTANGGWLRSTGTVDAADCSGYSLVGAAWQQRTAPGKPVTTSWFYGPAVNAVKVPL